MNENNPVLQSMRQELDELKLRYGSSPTDFNRYQLVRHEQRLAQWVPNEKIGA
ncbi:hypothetical protein [Synechococcus sp. LTW-R]|uniref:hypothetical protein n=1 Tax=Synechococcus sp. LTW-R TaxID=2751170 RepID=UPI0016271D65|nr:hypothetical protein [Synechococcus sp. LTW-R]QNG30284.1 hypothetical protein H0O22_03940 [Synechococcus sp. LTW-R]